MLTLTFKNDGHITKRCFRFKEVSRVTDKIIEQKRANVGTLYMKKDVFENEIAPDKITVEIKW